MLLHRNNMGDLVLDQAGPGYRTNIVCMFRIDSLQATSQFIPFSPMHSVHRAMNKRPRSEKEQLVHRRVRSRTCEHASVSRIKASRDIDRKPTRRYDCFDASDIGRPRLVVTAKRHAEKLDAIATELHACAESIRKGQKHQVMKELGDGFGDCLNEFQGHVIETAVKLTEHVNMQPVPRFDEILEASDKDGIRELCDGDLFSCEVEHEVKEDPLRYLRKHVEQSWQDDWIPGVDVVRSNARPTPQSASKTGLIQLLDLRRKRITKSSLFCLQGAVDVFLRRSFGVLFVRRDRLSVKSTTNTTTVRTETKITFLGFVVLPTLYVASFRWSHSSALFRSLFLLFVCSFSSVPCGMHMCTCPQTPMHKSVGISTAWLVTNQ